MKVIVCKPNHRAKVVEIENTLEAKQEIVGGYIEAIPMADDVYMVCNEESKLLNLEQNRILMINGEIADVIMGTFLLCGVDGEDFADMPEDKINLYCHLMNTTSVYWINKKCERVFKRHTHREKVEDQIADVECEVEDDEETLADAEEVLGA